jgi:hypothetical protein
MPTIVFSCHFSHHSSECSEPQRPGRETSIGESDDPYYVNCMVNAGMFTDPRGMHRYASPSAGLQLDSRGTRIGLTNSQAEPLTEEYLLTYCMYSFQMKMSKTLIAKVTTSIVTPPDESWFLWIAKHPPLYSAILFVSAVCINRRQRLHNSEALYFYRFQTIRLAHEVLSLGSDEEKTSDEMIMVGVITLYYTIPRSIFGLEYETHLKGIEQMIAARGGIANLTGVLARWLERLYGPWSEGFDYSDFEDAVLADRVQKLGRT